MADIPKLLHQLRVVAMAARKVDSRSADIIDDGAATIKDLQAEVSQLKRSAAGSDARNSMLSGLVRELTEALHQSDRMSGAFPDLIASDRDSRGELAARGGEA